VRAKKQYSFKDEHVASLFKLFHKSNKLKLPEARRPEEVGKTDDPNYCLHHKKLAHPMKSCYIFKVVFQALINADVLKLHPEQQKVTANMTSSVSLQFGRDLPSTPTRVAPIPKGKLRVISTNPHNKKENGLAPVPTPQGEITWVLPDLIEGQQ